MGIKNVFKVGAGESLRSLEHLVYQCVVACIASRDMVHSKFLTDGDASRSGDALQVEVKGTIAHKQGAQDLVTAADIAVQKLIFTALGNHALRREFTVPSASAVNATAFSIVGEESITFDPDAPQSVELFGPFIEHAKGRAPCRAAKEALLSRATPVSPTDEFTVFVDPIDATVAFVKGRTEAPMTLIGVTRNGTPVAGVVTRIFSDGATDDPQCPSVSWCVLEGPCVLWGRQFEWKAARPSRDSLPIPTTSEFRVTCSGTSSSARHKAVLDTLVPVQLLPAHGAGNKFMMVAQGAATVQREWTSLRVYADAPDVDAFVCASELSLWDTCAPHAFVKWFHGDVTVIDPAKGSAAPIDYLAPTTGAVPRGGVLVAGASPRHISSIAARLSRLAHL